MQFQGIGLRAHAVTPHDSNSSINGQCLGLFVGGAGDVKVTMSDGVDCTFSGVTAGSWMPISAIAVKSTGTTATSIVAILS